MSFFTDDDKKARREATTDIESHEKRDLAALRKYCENAAKALLPEVLSSVKQAYRAGKRNSSISYSLDTLRERFGMEPRTDRHYGVSVEDELLNLLVTKGLSAEIDHSDRKENVEIRISFELVNVPAIEAVQSLGAPSPSRRGFIIFSKIVFTFFHNFKSTTS